MLRAMRSLPFSLTVVLFTILNFVFAYGGDLEKLIFYHIPKTGGTTVTSLLNQQFPPHTICPDNFYYEIEQRSFTELMNFRFIRGHFFFHSNLLKIPHTKKIVFLRNPVERVLSEQRFFEAYYLQHPDLLYKEHFLPPGQPIKTVKNQQCRFLSSLNPLDPMISDAMHLKSAKHNLEHAFFFIGLTEKMDESITRLYSLMGWNPPTTIPKYQATAENPELRDPSLLEAIQQQNWADIELYEFAKNLFMRQKHT